MYFVSSHSRGRALLPRLRALLTLQRSEHTAVNGGDPAGMCTEMGSALLLDKDKDHMELHHWKKLMDIDNWKMHDSRTLGIQRSMISLASWRAVKILHDEGYEAYLVGGCVRDLILKRIPKDFDVITTADLEKVKKIFHRSIIIGQRFPICKVFLGNSYVEVSSFDTATENSDIKNKCVISLMSAGCDERDILRCRNCMDRDFTINSLFYDPFVHKIYDYSDSLMDLKSSKLRALGCAELSFTEDCARILRGLRLAARLKLSVAEETEAALRKLSSSVSSLNKGRLFMELNYMLSYGAAERSLCLLKRYHLLEFLLPIHNAYLTERSNLKSPHDYMMLMKLFSNLDLLVSCDRPSSSTLWLAILAFHMALIKNPQDVVVVLAFASLLYHRNWNEGITYARGHMDAALRYDTEILDSGSYLSDDELAERVTEFTTLMKVFINVLTDEKSLEEEMANFPGSTCSGLVFTSLRMGDRVQQLFETLVKKGVSITSLNRKRMDFEIDYGSLAKGDISETSFVLGKIIIDTMIPAGSSGKEQNSKVEDGRDEIKPLLELELSGEKKSIGDQNRNRAPLQHEILSKMIHRSMLDEFQAILGDVIHESINDDGSKRVELNHDKRFQLSARKHLKKRSKCNDPFIRKQATSMEDHHFLEEESVEENGIAVGRDHINLVHKRLTSKRDAEEDPNKVGFKKVLSILGGHELPFRKHSKMLKKCHDVEKQRTSTKEDHYPGEKGVVENKIEVDRHKPNVDCIGPASERNAEHNLKIVASKKDENVERLKALIRHGGSNKEELIHDQRVQLPARKHPKILDNCLDMLIKNQRPSIQEQEHIEGNKIVVDRDKPYLDRRGQSFEGKAEHNLENDKKSKKAVARLSSLF